MPKKKKINDFEAAIERLEQIVDNIDQGELPLQEAISLYKEGIELAAFCAENLQKAEQEVFELRKATDGIFELVKFNES